MHDALTISQKILKAADHLESEGHRPFTIEALTVAAWKIDPHAFGLKGFNDQYPNANVVYAAIMGERRLVSRGWLTKVGPKLYTLSVQGRLEVRANGHDRKPLPKIAMSEEGETELGWLLSTKAALRFRSGQWDTINWTDALVFWCDSEPEDVERIVGEARGAIVNGVVRFRDGREVSQDEVEAVGRVNAWMLQTFKRQCEKRKAVVHA